MNLFKVGKAVLARKARNYSARLVIASPTEGIEGWEKSVIGITFGASIGISSQLPPPPTPLPQGDMDFTPVPTRCAQYTGS